jgi:hypothetical protein
MSKERTFDYEGKHWACTEEDILSRCGSGAERLVKCRKDRYGFQVVYEMKSGSYDERDSSLVTAFVPYRGLLLHNNQVVD